MSQICPRFGRGWHKNSPHSGDIFDQPLGKTSSIRGKPVDHVGDHAVLSLEGAVLVTFPGTESSYLRKCVT